MTLIRIVGYFSLNQYLCLGIPLITQAPIELLRAVQTILQKLNFRKIFWKSKNSVSKSERF